MKSVRIENHHYLINWLSNSSGGTGYFEVLYFQNHWLKSVFESETETLCTLDYTRKLAKLAGLRYNENRGGLPITEFGTPRFFLIEELIKKHHQQLIAE